MQNYDDFEILSELGQGGMGKVYKAKHLASGKVLALKVVKDSVVEDERIIQRFQKEAQAAVRLKHPNIVRTYGFGILNGGMYIAMEFIEGETIAERIRCKGAFGVHDTLYIVRQIAEALAYSHSLGVIHRDIKPLNIVFMKKKQVKILDFGIAKTMWDFEMQDVKDMKHGGDMLMTMGQRLGTPVYMAPEQMRNDPIDGRADIYALGATMFEMLTGQLPFNAPDIQGLKKQKDAAVHPNAEALKKKFHPLVSGLVLQMLSKERSNRPRTANKLIEQLDEMSSEMELVEKVRKRTGRYYQKVWDDISLHTEKIISKFLDIATEPQVIAWLILLLFIAALFPIFWALIQFLLDELGGM